MLFFSSDGAPTGFLAPAVRDETGDPFAPAVLTERARAMPLLGVDGAAPVPDLLPAGLGDVAPPLLVFVLAGELRPVGVFLGGMLAMFVLSMVRNECVYGEEKGGLW